VLLQCSSEQPAREEDLRPRSAGVRATSVREPSALRAVQRVTVGERRTRAEEEALPRTVSRCHSS
ncbi:hypothetical protein AAVH_33850, partial [Aphelenchoides avenae]